MILATLLDWEFIGVIHASLNVVTSTPVTISLATIADPLEP
jgi:hypothetical protein